MVNLLALYLFLVMLFIFALAHADAKYAERQAALRQLSTCKPTRWSKRSIKKYSFKLVRWHGGE